MRTVDKNKYGQRVLVFPNVELLQNPFALEIFLRIPFYSYYI
jgi:hypothetical protein